MHICFISNLYPPYVLGGAEVYLQNLVSVLSREHQITLISTCPFGGVESFGAQLQTEGSVRIYRFYPANLFHLYQRPKSAIKKSLWYLLDVYNYHARKIVWDILNIEKPDLVHTHNLKGLSVSVWDAVKELGLPLVHTIHDYHLICRNSMLLHGKEARLCDGRDLDCKIYRPVMKKLVDSKPDLVLAPSEFVLQQHVKSGYFLGSRREVVRLWSDPPDTIVTSAGAKNKRFQVLYMGAISRHKGVRYLIEAFRRLSDSNASLDIVGTGDQEMDICRALASGDERIKFWGFIKGEEKEKAFARASVVVLPSVWYDNAPVVISESLARGIPVVASRIGGIPELITQLYNGLLFEPRNVDELVACLETLLSQPDLLTYLSSNAKISGSAITATAHAAQLGGLYQEVICGAGNKY